jgi:hypothetical protein
MPTAKTPHHPALRQWLTELVQSETPFGVAGLVLSGFLRIDASQDLQSAEPFRPRFEFRGDAPCAAWLPRLAPGPRHWQIFTRLCQSTGAAGNGIPDPTSPLWQSSREWSGLPPMAASPAFLGSSGDAFSANLEDLTPKPRTPRRCCGRLRPEGLSQNNYALCVRPNGSGEPSPGLLRPKADALGRKGVPIVAA